MQIHIARDSGRKTETGSPRLLYVCKLDGTELMYPRSAHTPFRSGGICVCDKRSGRV